MNAPLQDNNEQPAMMPLDFNDIKALLEMAAPRGSAENGVVLRMSVLIRTIEEGQLQAKAAAQAQNGHEPIKENT